MFKISTMAFFVNVGLLAHDTDTVYVHYNIIGLSIAKILCHGSHLQFLGLLVIRDACYYTPPTEDKFSHILYIVCACG